MKAELIALGAALGIFVAMATVAKRAEHQHPSPPWYCTNTKGFWLDKNVWADPGFPDYVPCKLLKLEQDV